MMKRSTVIAVILLPALAYAVRTSGVAGDKLPKSDVKYQDHPNGTEKCAQCKFFLPAKGDSDGTCQMVDGAISPNGWCEAYSAKSG
jgi:hypothetical protein